MRSITIALSIIILIMGCEGEQGPPGPQLSGNIEGWVTLYDDLGNLIPDKSGVMISIEGTSLSTYSNIEGYWKIVEATAGIYDFFFQKDNFFTTKLRNIQFVGGGTYYLGENTIRKIPPNFVTELEASNDDISKYININITTSNPDTVRRSIRVLFSKDPIGSSRLIEYMLSSDALLSANSVHCTSIRKIDDWYYSLYGLETGEPLYLVAYVLPIIEDSSSVSPYNPATKLYEFYRDNVTLSNVAIVNVP
jgi:hypothetical protein